jgi:UDP-N-acetylglucosamine 4,6-dehydratase/5-epimerase
MFKDKTFVITGGTGSFGNAVLNRLLETEAKEIRVFSRDEKKQDDMRGRLKDKRVKFYIGDVRDYQSVNSAFFGADFVFHAAALKQVPSCEFYPMEAVKTNILGAQNVLKAAISNKIDRCVVLSTDKAVYPINAMGMSKALMEKLMAAEARQAEKTKTVICATRYGNVMASRGSVIPLFLDQVKSGTEITITDEKMTRFLMTLEESVDLVFFAFNNARNGDIFVQKAPACTVKDLVSAIKNLLNSSIETKIIGTRHGEKLYESLISREEMLRAEDMGDYFRVHSDSRDINYDEYFTEGNEDVSRMEDYTSHNTQRLDVRGVEKTLMKLKIVRERIAAL